MSWLLDNRGSRGGVRNLILVWPIQRFVAFCAFSRLFLVRHDLYPQV